MGEGGATRESRKNIKMVRKICRVKDCKRLTRNKGIYKGKTRYGNTCGFHHSGLSGWQHEIDVKNKIKNKKCTICGYNKAPCDRHRLIPSDGYVKKNVVILCPNCHREVTFGITKL